MSTLSSLLQNPATVIFYPNPVVDQLNLSIQNAKTGEYHIMVIEYICGCDYLK